MTKDLHCKKAERPILHLSRKDADFRFVGEERVDDAVEGLLVAASLVQVGVRDGADGEAREDVEEAVDVAKGDLGELVDVGGRDLARSVDVEIVDHGPEVLGLVLGRVDRHGDVGRQRRARGDELDADPGERQVQEEPLVAAPERLLAGEDPVEHDDVDLAGQCRVQGSLRFGDVVEHHFCRGCRFAPVRVIAGERDRVALAPRVEQERAGAVGGGAVVRQL